MLLCGSHFLLNVQDLESYKKDNTITMFGVDYTQTYFVGEDGFNDPIAIANQFPQKWNVLFYAESDKYSIEKYMLKASVTYSLSKIEEVNKTITSEDVKSRIVNEIPEGKLLTKEGAEKLALSKHLKGETKYGVIFFASEYNKITGVGYYYAVVLDIGNNSVIFSKKLQGKTGGFGFRNYWASTFHDSLKQFRSELKKGIY